MSDLPPSPAKVWLRSFYGFSPEEDGYIGWTDESARERMMRLVSDGDLFMIYGASSSETAKAQRNRVMGFLQVQVHPIMDTDKASATGLQWKRANGFQDKWRFALPVRRAWRADESVLLERIAPTTYRPSAGQAIAVWSPPLLPEEMAQALKIKVREVNVYGEPSVAEEAPAEPLGHVFKPSRGFPGSSGDRTSTYEDGPTLLYVARFEGDALALLGRPKTFADKSVLVKVGVAGDLVQRAKQLNVGFPPASIGKWKMALQSQPYPDRQSAEVAEQRFKDNGAPRLTSVGGEFFLGDWTAVEGLFASIPGTSRFGK